MDAQMSSETILGPSYDIYQILLDIGTDDRNFKVCKDKKEKLIYVLAFDSRNNGTSLGLFMISIDTHKFYKINISSGEERHPVKISRIWCSFGDLYGYEENTNLFLMKRKQDIQFMSYHLNQSLNNIYLDEYEKNNLALLTRSKDLFFYDFERLEWNLVSSNASDPKWFNKDFLFYLHNIGQLKSYSLSTKQTKLYEKNDTIQYNIVQNILWIHQWIKLSFKMNFIFSSEWVERYIDLIYVKNVIEVFFSNNIVYVLVLTEYDTEKIYVFDKDKLKVNYFDHDSLGYMKNHVDNQKYLHVIDGLPGVILFTKTILNHGKEALKTFISYNGGKSWSYLKFKNKQHTPCKSQKCDISILPDEQSLSDVIKYSPTNPLLIVAPCTVTTAKNLHQTRLMVSDDGGLSWIFPQFIFDSIEILNEGEILVGIESQKYAHYDFKYETIDDKCYAADYKLEGYFKKKCTGKANQFVESAFPATKSQDNICDDGYDENKELEICQYQFNYNTISLLVNNKLLFYNLYKSFENINEFPSVVQGNDKMFDVKIDKYQKCIYGHVQKGIARKCYSTKDELSKPFEMVIIDSNIYGIEIDPRNGHLYYHDKIQSLFFTPDYLRE
ncbi:hypothetical protein RF11_05397 [Thelohanellus kitauei]|uniref:Sortilin N-terminal domain-containing protein n=1 Tax=Thelohanellus kitauei TaxID=669202 RepID=A0A0C2JF12_THEKT|nr:hypothetical protein RF11_05397 [Thelohanellus kitauei]